MRLDYAGLSAKIELLAAVGSQVSTRLDADLHSLAYAAWKDSTGDARQSLQVSNYADESVIGIEYGGTVPYLPVLENRHGTFERITADYAEVLKQELIDALNI